MSRQTFCEGLRGDAWMARHPAVARHALSAPNGACRAIHFLHCSQSDIRTSSNQTMFPSCSKSCQGASCFKSQSFTVACKPGGDLPTSPPVALHLPPLSLCSLRLATFPLRPSSQAFAHLVPLPGVLSWLPSPGQLHSCSQQDRLSLLSDSSDWSSFPGFTLLALYTFLGGGLGTTVATHVILYLMWSVPLDGGLPEGRSCAPHVLSDPVLNKKAFNSIYGMSEENMKCHWPGWRKSG